MKSSLSGVWRQRGADRANEPQRWVDRPAGATAEDTAGVTLRRARQATEPSDEAMRRLSRIQTADHLSARSSSRRLSVGRLALAAGLVVATGGAVGAAGAILHLTRRPASTPRDPHVTKTAVTPPAPMVGGRRTHERGPTETAPPPEPAPPAPSSSSSSLSSETTELADAPAPRGLPPAPARRGPGPTTEAHLITGAFRALRTDGDPGAALKSLERYERAFPRGALRGEARIARVEALIALGRRVEALPLLTAVGDGDGGLTRNVQVTRGELLAEAGRCANAAEDFDRILTGTEHDDAAARALYGRASCRLLGGEVAAGRRDLRRYLALYPQGTSAAAAREALRDSP